MKKKNILIINAAALAAVVATAAISSFLIFRDRGTEGVSEETTEGQVVEETKWRAAADLSRAAFENLTKEDTLEVSGKTITFSSAWIKNPSTSDRQSVRIYEAEGNNLPLVVLVPGGTGDGSDFEKQGNNSDANRLAAEGFVVIVYSPLGTGESEGELNYQGFDDQDGLAAIIAAGKKLDNVKQDNIGLASFSYGVTGATGVLARYPDLEIKYYSDWEGPASRKTTTFGCKANRQQTKESAPGSFSCTDNDHWVEREASAFIQKAAVDFYWRIQQKKDHAQKSYEHTLEMMQAAADNIPWVKLNDGEVNAEYKSENELPIVENEQDFFGVHVIPHLVEMAAFSQSS